MTNKKNLTEQRQRRQGYLDDLASTGVLAGAGAYLFSQMSFLEPLRESLYHARHAGRTVSEIVQGGPEGMRAAKNLEEAIAMVNNAARANSEAGEALKGYMLERQDLVRELVVVYKENETFAREAERLKIQVEGMLKNFFEVGNTLKPDFWKSLDEKVMKIYGVDKIEALEKSERLREFYKNARQFYDVREKNEHTVKEFANYLAKVKEESVEKNERFNELFPEVIGRVKEGYEVEDILFETRSKKEFTKEKIAQNKGEVESYRANVDNTYAEVRKDVPIAAYNDTNWVDIATNPLVLGVGAALMAKGATKILPRIIERPLRMALAAPITLPIKGAKIAGKTIWKGINTLRNRNKPKEIGK